MELARWILHCHFRPVLPVLLPWVSKNDDEEPCFLKLFGFISVKEIGSIKREKSSQQWFPQSESITVLPWIMSSLLYYPPFFPKYSHNQ